MTTLWSLAVEEWAYLLLAVMALSIRRTGLPAMPFLLLGGFACALNGLILTLAGGDYYAVYWRTDVRIASILLSAGIFLALRGRAVMPLWPVAAAGLGVLLSTNHVPIR